MSSATNVDANAVNTIRWLSSPDTTIVVPIYQRQYRWDIGGCEQLLSDIRAVADSDAQHTHFLASILSARNADDDTAELVLIDGQQRITTLMLLVAALRHTVADTDPALAAELHRILVREDDPARTKLRPHRAWAEVFEDVVLGRESRDAAPRESRFEDNYAFFRSQIRLAEAPRIWRGLLRLEHVAITLGPDANAQQIFESLNSTGEPLRDHELIHNYVLMGLTHAEQSAIEDEFWLPIERSVGDAIGSFWRHYLVMRTGREVAVAGERGVYDAFRQEFPRLTADTLRGVAAEWRAYADVYGLLLDPRRLEDAEIGRHFTYVNTFGRGMYPLVMRTYREYLDDEASRADLLATLEHVQSMLLRRAVVGLPIDRLVARMCRARLEGRTALLTSIARITPSDERVRIALKYTDLPHAAYVLGRLADVDAPTGFEVAHITPLSPADDWTGDGTRAWADYSEDEQNSHRALAQTLGNLTLLEQPLAERAFDADFPTAQRVAYSASRIALTRELADLTMWGTPAIAARTAALTARFMEVWRRPATVAIDDDGLTPILDAQRRRGWPRGWEREFEYVEYRGEHWEIYDVKSLFNRIFTRLWADARPSVVAFSARRGGPVYDAQAWNGHWDALGEDTFLYMGWDSRYMLTALQGVLDEAGIASEVFVKYSYVGAAM